MFDSCDRGIPNFIGQKANLSKDISGRKSLAHLDLILRRVLNAPADFKASIEDEKDISPGVAGAKHGITRSARYIMAQ